MIPPNPELILEVDLESSGTRAYLVIDRTVWDSSWGGLRIVPDPSLEETIAAAHSMTLKYAFIGLSIGGAKASLQLSASLEAKRSSVIRELGGKLSSILREHRWLPGIDMGSNIEDIKDLYAGAGIDIDLSHWTNQSAVYTAWSLFVSTLAALEARGDSIRGRTFVVQGFGKVGTVYSALMSSAGARLVGLSTRTDAIVCRNGVEVAEAGHLRASFGDSFPLKLRDARQTDPGTLLELEADIAVPCARAWAIHHGNWKSVKAIVIPCGANAAIDHETEKNLFQSGRTVIPDFVANCGGVFGSFVDRYLPPAEIRQLIETTFRRKLDHILAEAAAGHKTVSEVASGRVFGGIHHSGSRAEKVFIEIGRRALPIIPDALRRPVLRRYCAWKYFRD